MPVLHESVKLALGQEPAAIDALISFLPESKQSLPVLPLPPPRSPGESLGILVGRILPKSDGTVVISQGRKKYCQVVFAPPLSIKYRAALVYCSDFRIVRSLNAGAVLEVFSSHVKVLFECSFYGHPRDLRILPLAHVAFQSKEPTKRRDVSARVTAKSPIMGTGRNSRFMLEISNMTEAAANETVAVFVIFMGADALEWWPFLHVGSAYAFIGLTLATLPHFGNQYVYKVTDDTVNIHDYPSAISYTGGGNRQVPNPPVQTASAANKISSAPPAKRMRCNVVLSSPKNPMTTSSSVNCGAFNWSQRTITYQGVITEILSDGRIRLDDAVYLHLGGDYSWCAGGEKTIVCFRVGARIEALNVLIAFQRGVPTTVFPTARTIVNVIYFGTVPEGGIVRTRKWHRSPWFRYWRHLSPAQVLWAQELYDTLPRKFRLWLVPTQCDTPESIPSLSQASDLADRMLGSKDDAGLVEFLMELLTGTNNLFQQSQAPTHFYSDFLKRNHSLRSQFTEDASSYPYPATIAELSAAVDVKWIASSSGKASRDPAICNAMHSRVHVEMFSEKDLSEVLSSASHRKETDHSAMNSREARSQYSSDIVLIGMLEGCSDDNATAQISDATGTVLVELTGNLDPSLLGAIIVVELFQVAVEFFPCIAVRNTTFILNPASIKVLIDGPYVDFDVDERSSSGEKNFSQKPATQAGFSNRDANLRLHMTQSGNDESAVPGMTETEFENDEYPLAAICIEKVSSIAQHSDGQSRFRLHGHLIAFCENRYKSVWKALNHGQEFWKCCLVVHGNAACKMRASLKEGLVYAIGCSDFGDCDNIGELCQKRAGQAAENGRPLLLYSVSTLNGLWVQGLQKGEYMRFATNGQSKPNLPASPGEETGIVRESTSDLKKAVECCVCLSQQRAQRSFLELLSPQWKPLETSSANSVTSDDINDSLLSVEGIFLHSDTLHETNRISDVGRKNAPIDFQVVLRDKETSVLMVHVLFFATDSKPRGLVPGSTIQLVNVVRRVMGGNGNVTFTSCEMTRVIRVPCDDCCDPQPSLCCHRPLLQNQNMLEKFPSCFLWSFCAGARRASHSTDSKMHGIVRVNLVELKEIKFFVNYHRAGCTNCKSVDEADWCAGAHAIATVEDGTTHGEVECQTFQSTMELLGATEDDSRVIRQELPLWQPARDALTNWTNATNPLCTSNSRADVSLKRLLCTFQRSVYMLARNLTPTQQIAGCSESPLIDEAEVRGHNLGFGRRLWTAESCAMHQVRVEALVVFEEDCWLTSKDRALVSNPFSIKERFNRDFK